MQNGSSPGTGDTSDASAQADGRADPVRADGQADPVRADGRADPVRADGQADPVRADGRADPVRADGQADPVRADGQADPVRADGQADPGRADGEVRPGPADDRATDDRPDADGVPGLRASLEAIMLVADEPVSEVVIAQVLERPRAEVAGTLRELAASYAGEQRGFDLREVAGGWRFYTREECAPVVERFVSDGQEVRLTQAALHTLAVVAYRQPRSRAPASAVRGVNR